MHECPNCHCFQAGSAKMENVVYDVSTIVAQALHSVAQHYGLCSDAMPYVLVTTVVMMMRGVAGLQSGDVLNCDAQFEALLAALPDGVRMRDQVLDALLERARQGGTTQ